MFLVQLFFVENLLNVVVVIVIIIIVVIIIICVFPHDLIGYLPMYEG
jgi:hypothetical protein